MNWKSPVEMLEEASLHPGLQVQGGLLVPKAGAAGAIQVSLQPPELKERMGSKDEGMCVCVLSCIQLFTTP